MFNTIKKLSQAIEKFSQEVVADAAKPLNKKTNIKSSSEKEEPVVLINEDMFETDSESEEEEDVEVLEENVEEENIEEEEEALEEKEEDIESVEEKEEEEALEENIEEEEEALEENVEVEAVEQEEEEEKVSEYEEDNEYDEDNEYHEDEKEEEDDEKEESEESEEEEPIPESPPRRRGGNGTRERKRTPANMDIRQYDRLEMRLGSETWWIECYSEHDFGAFEVIDAPYRRDIEGYIFRKGDRYGGERKIVSPINFIFQQFVESVGIARQKRTPWTCIYKWRDGVSTKLNWV
jgi:hypothetical protein